MEPIKLTDEEQFVLDGIKGVFDTELEHLKIQPDYFFDE